ncbi:hypothetical protein LTS10_003292 [Elasticomyces elasticus]|nr:hypothetical protein LTS10_003292 [Elasticomyces elasticus]
MAPTSDTAKLQDAAFRIFDLPLELRYRVYVRLMTTEPKLRHTRHGLRITSFQLPAARLLCKQMRDEYDDETRPWRSLIIECCPENLSTLWSTIRNYHSHQIETIRTVYFFMDVTLPEPTDDDRSDLGHVVTDMHRCIAELAAWSRVRTTILTMLEVYVEDEAILAKDIGAAHSFLRLSSTKFGDVRVRLRLMLQLPLLSANPDNVDNQEEEDLVNDALCHEDNYILYEAKTCLDEDSWHGLTLTTRSVGAESFDALMAKAKLENTKALEAGLSDDLIADDDCSEDEDFQGESLDE